MNKAKRCSITVSVLTGALVSQGFPQPATAYLNIVVNYVGLPATEPSYDPGGTQLTAILNAAADYWGRNTGIIQDNHTITIDISWAELSDANFTLASHSNLDGGAVPKPTHAMIQFDRQFMGVDRVWYFDPTPTDHSEYALAQTYYGNLSGPNRLAWFNGSPPNLLEVGYQGTTVPGAPVPAATGNDLLSTAVHEMGHALGLTQNVANSEIIPDLDYDVNPNFVGGATMAIVDAGYHLAATTALMCGGCGAANTRRLPSATDVFAVASASNWSDIRLKQVDYLGGPVLNDPTAWIGGKLPNPVSDAYVRSFGSGGITVAQTSMQFRDLNVFDAWIVTALQTGVTLDVQETTTINGFGTTQGTTKIVLQGNSSPGSLLDTKDLMLVNGGRLELDGQIPQAAAEVNRIAKIDEMSSIYGRGFVLLVNDQGGDMLINNGLIEANGGDLRFAATNTVNPVFDLDGDNTDNPGDLRAVDGNLSFFGQHLSDFDGELRIGGGHEATFEHRFIIGENGAALLFGNTLLPATLNGADLVFRGDVAVDKLARIGKSSADLATFEGPDISGDGVHVFTGQSDDRLTLDGPAVFSGGLYDGDGTLKQNADITIETDTQFDMAVYDWGNSVPTITRTTLVDTDARFTVNSPTTGTADNEYRGIMHLDNAELEVNTTSPWMLPPEETVAGVPRTPAGTLILQDRKNGSNMPRVLGQSLTVGGNIISLGGPGAIEPDLTTEPTADIDVRAEAELWLEGATTYNGGNIHGPGTLRQFGDANVVGNTTIGTSRTDWDGSEGSPSNTTIQPGTLFQISGLQIDDFPATDGYDGHVTVSDTAALVVFTSGAWFMDGLMTMQGQPVATPQAIVDGVTMVNTGRVEGNGWFQTTVQSDGTIAPGLSAGAMRFEQHLTLTANSVLEHELGGIAPITEFDRISVAGNATLDGTLQLGLIGGYIPFLDHEFKIITSSLGIVGTFSQVLFPTMPGVAFCIQYDANAVTVTTELIGDLNGDGFVGIDDLNTVLGNWNAGTPPAATASQAIPEPASVLLLLTSGVLVSTRRHQR